ncbi:neutral alpha-glucosidase C isoform X6 [Panthera pardus]|uniref:Neutral alpha-glucosidase C isoform X6 n=1 Tax=Panthera pardus TaxID=9691 RepID=A0A9W2UFG7_PANPR|nr:neutral alpha-glucosidase C isoform X3 [Panthera tigris]XP_053745140.1 neutral alpha-glucosidase C isoform X6 [Panthera pardus]XP_058594072.1 neutral alpha-glucosidase C isoform X6 [Neofelis nebulosa]XP_060474831.1 neutral alpha-glucosidase C isoform X5 [Panthera onca]
MEAAGKEEISVEDEAVDKNIFKDCSKIAFYRRQKQQLSTKSTYQALLDSATKGKDSTKFQILNEATKPVYKFSLETTLLAASPGMQAYL